MIAIDGTQFDIQSEQVRGEPRFYCIMRRANDLDTFTSDGVYDGSYDRRTIERRLLRRVEEHDEAVRARGEANDRQ